MDKISAEAYVKALKEARDKGKLNIDPILTKRVRDIASKLIAQTGTFRDDALKWKWQVNVVDEATVNKEAYENSKNKLTENLKNHLWDSSREETLQMIDDFMSRVHNENYSIATTNLISRIVDNIKELVIERYEAKDDSKFYAREFDALEAKLATIKNKRSKEYLETYKETAVQGDRMWKYLAVMLKTTSRIDKLAEALADFTEEARIG